MEENKTEVVTSFKGFDVQFRCRGFQYEVGGTYTHSGRVEPCESGFHACENPLDILRYYPLIDGDGKLSRFAIVEQSGSIKRHGEDSKIASAKINIKVELSLGEYVKRAVQWVIDHCSNGTEEASENIQSSSGHYAKLAASGDYAKLAASGDSAQLAASGHYAQLAASGENSVIASSSYGATAKGATGTWISLAEFGDDGKCIGFATGQIGADGLEPDVFYRASSGKLVRA